MRHNNGMQRRALRDAADAERCGGRAAPSRAAIAGRRRNDRRGAWHASAASGRRIAIRVLVGAKRTAQHAGAAVGRSREQARGPARR
jgi:hypothetical protein